MTCETAIELISAKLDGELTADQAAQLDRHLAQCSACRALLEELISIHAACEGLDAAPPPALREQILQNLPAQETALHNGKVVPIHWRRWTAMAASFALVALAAWHLPRLAVSPSTENTVPPSQTEETGSGDHTTQDEEYPVFTDASAVGSSPADLATLPPSPATPPPDSVKNDIVDVNAVSANPSSDSTKSIQQGAEESSIVTDGTNAVRVADEADMGAEVNAYQGQENDVSLPLMASARMAFSAPKQAVLPEDGSEESCAFGIAAFDEEVPEPHPELADGENVPAILFAQGVPSPVYCGILTLKDGRLLCDYPAQVQNNGETWYELPCTAFFALSEELKSSEADFTLRMTGADVSSSAQNGLVVVLP